MTDSEFLLQVEQAFDVIERAIDAADANIEVSRAGSVLTLELGSGAKVIINSQAPMQQIWVAGRSGAYHYAYREGRWLDTRDGTELYAALSRLLNTEGAGEITLTQK
jgi:CyaY protein